MRGVELSQTTVYTAAISISGGAWVEFDYFIAIGKRGLELSQINVGTAALMIGFAVICISLNASRHLFNNAFLLRTLFRR